VQPYAVIVPAGGAGPGRRRLDVVLHGRNATLNEVRFLNTHDGKPAPAGRTQTGLVLHVFGRTNNAYRWAGEADVFEAIEAVRRHYPVDERRIVLRGFSMGGAGAWHLGLHHPSSWCSVEAGAGFTETRHYAKLGDLPDYQEKALHIYDAADYALNAFNVPIAGYGGEDDPQLRASANVVDRLRELGFPLHTEGLVTRSEGIGFLQVVGAKMGHKVDPASARLLAAFHDRNAAARPDPPARRIRFETYTVKYGRVGWLSIEELQEHYRRATLDAEIAGEEVRVRTENVAVLGVDRQVGQSIRLDGREFPLIGAVRGLLPLVYFRRTADGWEMLGYTESRVLQENLDRRKHRNLQGPIDDAFTGPFLCVRGTGTPWHPAVSGGPTPGSSGSPGTGTSPSAAGCGSRTTPK
jgi:pimeloyl-ACP methyl ester carboxylesterase